MAAKKSSTLPWLAGGALAAGGIYLIAKRYLVQPEVEQEIPQDVFQNRPQGTIVDSEQSAKVRTINATTRQLVPQAGMRRDLAPVPKREPGFYLAQNLAVLEITLKKPKFQIKYDAKGEMKTQDRLIAMFDPGQIVSYNRGLEFCGATYGELPIYSSKSAIITPMDEFQSAVLKNPLKMVLIGEDWPGIKTAAVSDWGKTIRVVLPAGQYVVTPNVWPKATHKFKFFTKYWAWTKDGPRDLVDPDAKPQPKLTNEAAKRLLANDCTKYFTYIKYTVGGMAGYSPKTVELKANQTKRINVQQMVAISLNRWVKKEAGSKAFNVWCELTGRALRAATMGKADAITRLIDKFY